MAEFLHAFKAMKSLKLILITVLSVIAFSHNGHANSSLSCYALFNSPKSNTQLVRLDDYKGVLEQTEKWQKEVDALKSLTDLQLKQPLQLMTTIDTNQPIPMKAENYRDTKFLEKNDYDIVLEEGQTVLRNIEFGYNIGGSFRHIGTLSYMVIGKDNKVQEVGGRSIELVEEFKHHLLGRHLSKTELNRISEINTKLISYLRSLPEAQRRVTEFAKSRGWPEGITDKAQLAYFNKDMVNLFQWAKENGYHRSELRDAGWLSLRFIKGKPVYVVTGSNSIKIPFFEKTDANTDLIPLWRTRNLEIKGDGPKYLSWPLNRSIAREFKVNETLYNGWRLNEAKGKTIVITEGEFKCLIATEKSGILNVGIPGITQMTETILNALVAAQAKEYIVVLDRDPKAKALMRVDEITDSERAAYIIAKELQSAGAKLVKVGVLPDVFNGGKVGIDDLILAKGTKPYLKMLKESMTPEEFARRAALDPLFNEINYRQQKIRSASVDYQRSLTRGGNQAGTEVINKIKNIYKLLRGAFYNYLRTNFNGARMLAQPSMRFPYIPKIYVTAEKDKKNQEASEQVIQDKNQILTASNEVLAKDRFIGDILIMDFVPKDLKPEGCKPAPCTPINISSKSIRSTTLEEYLTHDFPKDDYQFEANVRFGEGLVVPLVIFKRDSGNIVALARLKTAESEDVNTDNSNNLFVTVQKILRDKEELPSNPLISTSDELFQPVDWLQKVD